MSFLWFEKARNGAPTCVERTERKIRVVLFFGGRGRLQFLVHVCGGGGNRIEWFGAGRCRCGASEFGAATVQLADRSGQPNRRNRSIAPLFRGEVATAGTKHVDCSAVGLESVR